MFPKQRTSKELVVMYLLFLVGIVSGVLFHMPLAVALGFGLVFGTMVYYFDKKG